MPSLLLDERPGGCRLRLRAMPNAKRDALGLREDGTLLVRIHAPAVDGAANDAILQYLGKELLHLPRSAVRISRGERSRDKVLEIDAPADAVRAALEPHLRPSP